MGIPPPPPPCRFTLKRNVITQSCTCHVVLIRQGRDTCVYALRMVSGVSTGRPGAGHRVSRVDSSLKYKIHGGKVILLKRFSLSSFSFLLSWFLFENAVFVHNWNRIDVFLWTELSPCPPLTPLLHGTSSVASLLMVPAFQERQ